MLKDKILSAKAYHVVQAEMQGVDEPVWIRGMSAHDANTLFYAAQEGKNPDIMAMVLVRCLCDAEGNRLLGDEDAQALSEQPSSVLAPLFKLAMTESGLSDEAREVLEKN